MWSFQKKMPTPPPFTIRWNTMLVQMIVNNIRNPIWFNNKRPNTMFSKRAIKFESMQSIPIQMHPKKSTKTLPWRKLLTFKLSRGNSKIINVGWRAKRVLKYQGYFQKSTLFGLQTLIQIFGLMKSAILTSILKNQEDLARQWLAHISKSPYLSFKMWIQCLFSKFKTTNTFLAIKATLTFLRFMMPNPPLVLASVVLPLFQRNFLANFEISSKVESRTK